ncbi:MAG TPA: hypothetical protein VG900_07385 [Hyphomicrobiaceae bacterium]|nr:hypothetical protein [Hyphomicrobiaceae bacterium]
MKFKHERNGQMLELSRPWLWTLVFGPTYFARKGVWHHVALGTLLGFATCGWSWFIYPFFANAIMRAHMLRQGWAELHEDKPGGEDWAARIEFKGWPKADVDQQPLPAAKAPGRRAPRQAVAVPVFGRRSG